VSIVERVREIVEPLLATRSLTVYDIEHSGSSLRITVESADASAVNLETIARITRLVSAALDEHDPIPSKYTLEVSSPGLERALRVPAHFRGAVGSSVSIKTVPSFDGARRVKGTLAAADDSGVTVDDLHLSYDDIEKARTIFEWGPAPKPGKTKAKASNS
jgi:ribosome maturation factor RimP